MSATASASRLEEISQDMLEVITQLCLNLPRVRRQAGDLKEIEFFTLAILQERGTTIVGNIQKQLGVLPAQMSRVIRSLEMRPSPFISCRINSKDKRKIDVCLTQAGEKALLDYQEHRIRRLAYLLHDLPEEEQEHLVRVLEKLRGLLDRPQSP